MGVYEGRAQLGKSMKELAELWAETRRAWDDARAVQLEKQFLAPLEADMRNAASAMEHMARLIAQARKDCE